jgi:membrane fusion protein (multidrug efflux system)
MATNPPAPGAPADNAPRGTPPAGNGPAPEKTASRERKRTKMLLIAAAVFAVVGIAWLAWYLLVGQWYESTDDAYVGGNVVQITPQVAGTVVAVAADDTDRVKEGQVLVRLDAADARIALEEAEANLGRTVRKVRTLFATSGSSDATVAQRKSDLERARADLVRREQLAAIGGVSKEEVQHAREAVEAANAAVRAAEEQHTANRALVDRTTLEDHPDVRAAIAKVHEAYLSNARTEIPAPVSGVVARRSVQVGQRVAAGTSLMAIVPLGDVWVDANFKEGQLRELRLGQSASVEADLYGRHMKYHGRIKGFGAGTGAAFALLPAQNATGNWIKVVQRVPVRIALDPQEVRDYPLQVGLSMKVEVDTHTREGERLPSAPTPPAAKQETAVFDTVAAVADARVAQIIARNAGQPVTLAKDHGSGR